jgi:hypothetical protein
MVRAVDFTSSEQRVSRAPALEHRWVRNPEFVSRRIGSEVLLIPIRQNTGDLESIYTLNVVGARVWELLDGTRTLAEVCDRMVAEFDVAAATVEADVVEFVDKLRGLEAVIAG